MNPVLKAGGVIVRKQSDGTLEALLLFRHAQQDWTFPKGHLEEDENLSQCMEREIKEETGLTVKTLCELPEMAYIDSQGKNVTTTFFLVTPDPVNQETHLEHPADQLAWIPFLQLRAQLSYENIRTYFDQITNTVISYEPSL